jgi:hypothetical protein
MRDGHGGGIFPSWPKEEQQASTVEQQDKESKEDVGIGDVHAQDNVTFSNYNYPWNLISISFPLALQLLGGRGTEAQLGLAPNGGAIRLQLLEAPL